MPNFGNLTKSMFSVISAIKIVESCPEGGAYAASVRIWTES